MENRRRVHVLAELEHPTKPVHEPSAQENKHACANSQTVLQTIHKSGLRTSTYGAERWFHFHNVRGKKEKKKQSLEHLKFL